jgi:hypothetical protein
MTTVTGEIKVIKDYGVDGKHNWFTVINDAEGIEHKAYSNANLSEFAKDDIVQVEGMTKSGKAGAYIACSSFMRVGEAMNQDPTPALTVSTPTYTPQAKPTTTGLTKSEDMLVVGCFTRGISTKSIEEVTLYIDNALNYLRHLHKGDKNEPFNNQF